MGRLKSTQTNTTVRTIAMIFLFWCYLCLAVSEAQECRQLKYSQPVQDRALTNHVILKIKTTRQDICNVKCFIEPNCLSYNVGPLDENYQYLCEINDSDEVLHPGDLVRRSGFAYQGTQSPCRNGACVKNSTCQAGYTSKGYRCICPTGYTGLSCSQDIDECDVDGGHDCHVNADCVNTEGLFNCTCSLGYIGDGRDCIECGAVGVEDRNKIPDARMNASTYFGSNFYPYFGRLNENRGDGAWCAKTSTDSTDYLQVDMGAVKSVCAVATQGEKVGSYWTTSYKVRLSTDAVTWKRYRENNVQKVFAGNTDQNSIVKHSVSPKVMYQARFVRFYPVSHHGHPCLRVEIFALK